MKKLLQIIFALVVIGVVLIAIAIAHKGRQAGLEKPGEEISTGVRVHTVPEGTPLKLALMPNAPTAFWNLVEQGLKKFEKETGTHVELIFPPTGKLIEQNQFLEDLVSQGYHGVSMSVIAPNDQVREINKALEKLNVITTDSDAPLSNRLAFVGPKQRDAGFAAGQEIARLLPNGGRIALFVGDLTAENAVERIRGIKEAIKAKKIEIVSMKEDGVDVSRARSQVEDVITAFSDLDLVVGLWSYNGPAIAQALKASNKVGQIKAVAFDEEEGTLDGIEKGIIECTVVLTPFDYGYVSARLLRDLAYKGESALPENRWIDTGFEVINKRNLAAFRAKLEGYRKW